MIKQIILSVLIPFSLMAMKPAQYPCKAQIHSVNKKLDPSTTLFAFDLDEVVLTGREPGYKQWIANNPDLGKAIGEVKKKYNLSDASEIISTTARDYPHLKEKAEEFQKVVVTAPQIKGTVNIIHQLKNNGYAIIGASNMTTSTYQAMVDNKTLPTHFSRDIFFVATNPLNKKIDGTYYEKPSREYYLNLKEYVKKHFPHIQTIVFTDDKLENANGAQNISGIISIHFKNPEQLRSDLKTLGIEI